MTMVDEGKGQESAFGGVLPSTEAAGQSAAALVDAAAAGEWLSAALSTGKGAQGQPAGETTLAAWVESLRGHSDFVARLRELKAAALAMPDDKAAADAYKAAKDESAWVMLAGKWPGRRRKQDEWQPSGIVFLESDGLESEGLLAAERERLSEAGSVLACYKSAGGVGLHVAAAVWPRPKTAADYKAAWEAASAVLALPGGGDPAVSNHNRLCYAGQDGAAYLRGAEELVWPVYWELPPPPQNGAALGGNGNGSGGGRLVEIGHSGGQGSNGSSNGAAAAAGVAWGARERHSPYQIANRNPVSLGVVFLLDHADALVIANDGNAAAAYYCDPATGLLDGKLDKLGGLLDITLETLVGGAWEEFSDKKAYAKFCEWAAGQRGAAGMAKLVKSLPIAIGRLRFDGLESELPEIHHPDAMDGEPGVWGCANGLLDIRGELGPELIDPAAARSYLVTANTGVAWNAAAQHEGVDKLFPLAANDWTDYVGWTLGHDPKRDLGCELTKPGQGKSTRREALKAALGDDYITSTRKETYEKQRYNRGGGAHNGGVFQVRRPAKLCFVPEIKDNLDVELMNEVSGDRVISARECGIKEGQFVVGAHLMLQGNLSEDGQVQLGIDAAAWGSAAAAFAERLRMLTLPELREEDKDPGLSAAMETDIFRQACLQRLAYHANRMFGFGPVAPKSELMLQRQQEQAEAELPSWVTECLQPAVLPMPSDNAGHALGGRLPLDSYHARQLVAAWCQDNGEKTIPKANAITRQLRRITGQESDMRSKVAKRVGSGRADAHVWRGWHLAESETGEEA